MTGYILVIDDSTTNNLLLGDILEESGYKYEAVLSGSDALNVMQKNLPELIILDLMMPNISGFDFLSIIKLEPRYKDIPVIIMSAATGVENMQRAKALGVSSYLIKPVLREKFIEHVKMNLAK